MSKGEAETAKLELALCGSSQVKLAAWALKFGPMLTEDAEISAAEIEELQAEVDMCPDDQSDEVDELETKLEKAETKVEELQNRLDKIADIAA